MIIDFTNLTTHWQQVNVIHPYLQQGGRMVTMVAYNDGSRDIFRCRCRYAVEQLCNRFYITMRQAEATSARWLGRETPRKMPLVLCEDLVLFQVGSGQPVALMLDRDTMALAVKTPWNDKNRNIGYVILRGMEIYHAVDCKEAETDLGLLSVDPDVTGGNGMQSSGNACWIPTGMSIRSLRDHLKRARELYRKYTLAYRNRLGT